MPLPDDDMRLKMILIEDIYLIAFGEINYNIYNAYNTFNIIYNTFMAVRQTEHEEQNAFMPVCQRAMYVSNKS